MPPKNHTKKEKDSLKTRREFMRSCGRITVAAVGGVAGLFLATRRRISLKGGSQTCVNQGICGTCGRLPQCELPAAASRKQRLRDPEFQKRRR